MKEYRNKELKYLMTFYVFLFILLCTSLLESIIAISNNAYESISNILEGILVSGIISVCVFLIDCIISSKLKDKMVGLFFIRRAGEKIFTKISQNKEFDDRFSVKLAKMKYKTIIDNLPKTEKEKYSYENANWYSIYQKNRENEAIKQSQKDYLLCRDLFSQTIVFLAIYFASLIFLNSIVEFSWKFLVVLLVFGVITNIATHVKMSRFVNTVIACDMNNKEGE